MFAATNSVLITALLCLSSLLLGAKPASHWLDMARAYEESSVLIFNKTLAAMKVNVKEVANKSGVPEDRLQSYLQGEIILDEKELDKIELYVKDVRETARKFFNGTFELNSKARELLHGSGNDINQRKFRRYAQIETEVRELMASDAPLTDEQQQLIATVNALTDDAFALLEHGVSMSNVYSYKRLASTSQAMLEEMLGFLKLTVEELLQRAELGLHTAETEDLAKNIADYQQHTAQLSDTDLQELGDALAAAIAALPNRRKKKTSKFSYRAHRMDLEEHLHILLRDFKSAVRVEHYLKDPRQTRNTAFIDER